MRRIDIVAPGVEEAKVQAFEQNATVIHDATKQWKRQGKPMFERPLKIFAASVLTKQRLWGFEGAAIIISLNEGKDNEKKYPHKLINHKRKGRCKLKRVIEIRDSKTHEVLGTAPNKTKAVEVAKEIVTDKRLDVYAKTRYESADIDFECKYYPTKGYEHGSYVVFAVEESDMLLYQKKLRKS